MFLQLEDIQIHVRTGTPYNMPRSIQVSGKCRTHPSLISDRLTFGFMEEMGGSWIDSNILYVFMFQMYFFASSHATILFKGWKVDSVGGTY